MNLAAERQPYSLVRVRGKRYAHLYTKAPTAEAHALTQGRFEVPNPHCPLMAAGSMY